MKPQSQRMLAESIRLAQLVHIHLCNGKILQTKVLHPVKGGFVFIDEKTSQESVVQFSDIKTISSF